MCKADEIENIIFVSSLIPPDHSGAGKRIYTFFKYLRNETEFNACLITHTENSEEGILCVKSYFNISLLKKLSLIITFMYALILLPIVFKNMAFKSRRTTLWLISTTPLTFAGSIWGYFFGYKIITQNTLLDSDEPGYKYPGDIFSIKYLLKRLQYKLSSHITSISPVLYKSTKKYHDNCSMIPNPVDLEKFESELPIEKRRKLKRVLVVGTLSYRKGTDIVLKTIIEVHKIDPEIEFIFVGPNDNLQEICNREGIKLENLNTNKIKFEGYKEDPYQYFKKCSLFFLPSRREGFGTVFIEAMSTGLPVIAKNIDGVTDFIFGNEYDSLLDSEESSCYSRMILRLINNKYLYNRLANVGIERSLLFDRDFIYNKYINIIKIVN